MRPIVQSHQLRRRLRLFTDVAVSTCIQHINTIDYVIIMGGLRLCISTWPKQMLVGYQHNCLPRSNDTGNWDVNASRIAGSVAQKVYVRPSELLWQGKSRHAPVVLHFSLKVWC